MLLWYPHLAGKGQQIASHDLCVGEASVLGELRELGVVIETKPGCDWLRRGGGSAERRVGAEYDEPAAGSQDGMQLAKRRRRVGQKAENAGHRRAAELSVAERQPIGACLPDHQPA